MTIGEQIKLHRRNRKLTQIALAKRLDISQEYLSHIETGKRYPGLLLLYNISYELNVVLLIYPDELNK